MEFYGVLCISQPCWTVLLRSDGKAADERTRLWENSQTHHPRCFFFSMTHRQCFLFFGIVSPSPCTLAILGTRRWGNTEIHRQHPYLHDESTFPPLLRCFAFNSQTCYERDDGKRINTPSTYFLPLHEEFNTIFPLFYSFSFGFHSCHE